MTKLPYTLLTYLFTSLLVLGCSTAPSYNPTVYPFELDQELMDSSNIKRVVIAPMNLGGPTRAVSEFLAFKQCMEGRGYELVGEMVE